ncbi:MAG TPA: peptidoglycan DD-metalloendopeptidase family protein, partial [Cyclobacteriaceae bacterium]|nr:peptidoglycan DD-metalloendopeptidase family protein [Cyclobacteriaceae bacterium]
MPGDTLDIEVWGKYVDVANANPSLQAFLASIASGTAAAGTIVDGSNYGTAAGNAFPFDDTFLDKQDDHDEGPKAFLNFLVFDRDYNHIDAKCGYKQLPSEASENGTGKDFKPMNQRIIIDKPGYVYIYLSNDNVALGGGPVEVYFDDFKVTHRKSHIVQGNDYYGFGLSFNEFNRENSLYNKFLYNGKEKQDVLDLNWLDYGARMYMPEIGRWGVVDPLADKMRKWSPYSYAFDNRIVFEDRDGNIPWPKIFGKNKTAQVGDRGFSSTPVPHPIYKNADGSPVMQSHEAVDLGAASGTSVRSLAKGTATVGYNDTDGHYVQVDHGQGYITMYDHLTADGITVKNGDDVSDGQTIGEVGQTGAATGPHLHLMMFKDGQKIDPTSINDLQEELHPGTGQKDESEEVSEKADRTTNSSPKWAQNSKFGAYLYFTFTGNDSGLSDYENDRLNGRTTKENSNSSTWSQIRETIQGWLSSNPGIQYKEH